MSIGRFRVRPGLANFFMEFTVFQQVNCHKTACFGEKNWLKAEIQKLNYHLCPRQSSLTLATNTYTLMSFSASRLQRLLNEAPVPFRLGDYIIRGFQFMHVNFGLLLAFMLVSTMISLFAQFLPIIGVLIGIIIAPVLQIGYSQFIYAAIRENRVDFSEFFKGFNKLGPLIATYLLTALITLLAVLPGLLLWLKAGMYEWIMGLVEAFPDIEDYPDPLESVDNVQFWLGMLAMGIGALLITSLFAWALNIVWFFEVGPLEALNASRKLIARNWISFIIFIFLAGILSVSGALLCGVGLLYTVPAMACAQFFAFAEATRILENEQDQPDIIDHFIA